MALPALKSKPTPRPRLVKAQGPVPYKSSVEEFYRLDLRENKRYELLEGVVYEMPATGPRHAAVVRKLQDLFYEQYRSKAMVSTQNPIYIGKQSLPQPDLALLQTGGCGQQHPQAKDVNLLVEVADTTLRYERNKLKVYAKTGIGEVWILSSRNTSSRSTSNPGVASITPNTCMNQAIAPQALKTKVELTW